MRQVRQAMLRPRGSRSTVPKPIPARSRRTHRVAGAPAVGLLAPAFGQAFPSLAGVPAAYSHSENTDTLVDLCRVLVEHDLGDETLWNSSGKQPLRFAAAVVKKAIGERCGDLGPRLAGSPEFLSETTLRNPDRGADIVIGCVDTRVARQIIETVVTASSPVSYWLDLGNNAASGQFILGQPLNALNRRRTERLRTVFELYPEIVDTSNGEDPLPNCSAAEALERQEPFVNQTLAASALAMLSRCLGMDALRTMVLSTTPLQDL